MLDQAVGTTYTLDLLALLRVPLAATTLPWAGAQGEPIENPFALLTALRRNASKVSLFCHAGATKIPPGMSGCSPSSRRQCTRYPLHAQGCSIRRYGCCGSWRRTTTRHAASSRRPLAQSHVRPVVGRRPIARRRGCRQATRLLVQPPVERLHRRVPGMAAAAGTVLNDRAGRRIELLADEVRRVVWELPEGFSDHRFHPIGHDGRPRWPIRDVRRLLVLSPSSGRRRWLAYAGRCQRTSR